MHVPIEPVRSAPVVIHHVTERIIERPTQPGPKPPVWNVRREPEVDREIEDEQAPTSSRRNFEQPPESKKDFEPPSISKKELDPEPEFEDEIEIDRDGDEGRWRTDDQVKELVIYRWEFKRWPDDVEDKSSKDTRTGLESYYELRYFKEGTNRKGERYSELYGKHRAKRDLWIDEESQRRAVGNAQLDASEAQSNVVHFPTRRSNSVS